MCLAKALGLRPLDRLEINSGRILKDRFCDRAPNQSWLHRPPFWFFQRITREGLLEIMAPGGATEHVSPTDVSNIVHGVPIEVRAMPRATFLQRLSLPLADRQRPAPDSDYALAFVRFVRKDRWNRVDQVFVQFHAEAHNEVAKFATPIHHDDQASLVRLATRLHMPIIGPGSAPGSADKGIQRAEDGDRYAAQVFIQAALAGNHHAVSALTQTAVRPLSTRQINTLRDT